MEKCELCNSGEFKYTCPRCNIKYCSLDCYKAENHRQCSEAFYKECIVNELKVQQNDPEDKNKVLEMLSKVQLEDEMLDELDEWEDIDSDDSEEGELADRLDGVDLNNADAIWEKLTKDEKEEFKSIVYNGEIEKIVVPAQPWWTQKLENKLVVDVQENEKKLKEILNLCPKVQADIKDFTKISTKKPASCIVFNIANVLGTYCYIFRLYNSDHYNYSLEATNNFISVCNNLKSNVNFEDLSAAIDSIILSCHNFNLFADLNTKQTLLDDVSSIFNGPSGNSIEFLLSALSDVISLFEQAKMKYKQDKSRKAKNTTGFSSEFPSNIEDAQNYPELKNQTHFIGCMKKLEFYLSFIKHNHNKAEWNVGFL